MKKLILITLTILSLFSCKQGKYSGLILVDPNTGSKYMLNTYEGETYLISKQEMLIEGKDTTYVFR